MAHKGERPERNKGRYRGTSHDKGSIEYAQKQAEEFVRQAIKSLEGITNSEGKTTLIETVRFIAGRTA